MSEGIELRALDSSHAERMLRWMRDPEVAENIGLRATPTLERTQEWIAKANANTGTRAWGIFHFDSHVGNVVLDCLDDHLCSARLSIYLGEASARGQGVASAALRLVLRRAFAEHGLHRIWLTVHERNTRAALVYARLGFRIEGILRDDFLLRGQRVNAILMGMLRTELPP